MVNPNGSETAESGPSPAAACYAVVEHNTGITVSITKKPKVSESGVITDDTGFRWYGHKLKEIPSHNASAQGIAASANDSNPNPRRNR